MFRTGTKVVCVDSSFPEEVKRFYIALPVKNSVYTVRGTTVGVGLDGTEGEIAVYLVGLHNPCSGVYPHRERGFKWERFREIEEKTDHATTSEPEVVQIGRQAEAAMGA